MQYSADDAIATWALREELEKKLKAQPWDIIPGKNMFDFYQRYFVPFGSLLTDMERNGS